MAPFLGPPRAEVVAALRSNPRRGFTVTVGRHAPQALVRKEWGRWVVRRLELNKARAEAAYLEAQRTGGMWMPEMEHAFLEPGAELAAAPTAAALADAIERLEWPFD